MKHPEYDPDYGKITDAINSYTGGLLHKPGYPKTTMLIGINSPSEMLDDFFDFYPGFDRDRWESFVREAISEISC